jgi:hypothetical protein
MKLKNFSALAASFAAGLVLCGCASPNMNHQAYYGPQNGYANSAPAFTNVTDPATGQTYLVPSQQNAYGSPYGAAQPRMPYSYNGLGALTGGLVGNAVSHGNAAAIATGAIVGGSLGASGDPCATPLNAGTALGAVAGYALGRNVGAGNGRKVAEVAGALIGGNIGGQAASTPRPGCR